MSRPELDRTTFEQLFRSHFKALSFFSLRYTKDPEAAREIVQDAFLSLWEKREKIDPGKPVKSYLYTAVRNRSLNYLRDRKTLDLGLLSIENLAFDESFTPPDHLVTREIHEEVERAISELPEKCREIFRMNRFGQMKYQEIADNLQISVKTVETQMSKALQHMRERLGKYLPVILFLFYYLKR